MHDNSLTGYLLVI